MPEAPSMEEIVKIFVSKFDQLIWAVNRVADALEKDNESE